MVDVSELARRIRVDVLKMTRKGESPHIGAAFSIADILAVLYGEVMKLDSARPKWEERDRFVLSKGHAGAAVYAALAETGFFPREKLWTYCQDGSDLSGHVSHMGVPGVEVSTGSLGHGLSIGVGMAYAAKLAGSSHRVFVLMSDGECDEGSVWEAALFAGHHRLDNLVGIVDYNKLQSLDTTENTMNLEPFADKWKSFGWHCEDGDGHDVKGLSHHLRAAPWTAGKPSILLAHTTKGKGVSFMENQVSWHYRTARGAEFDAALEELGGDV